MSVSNIGNTQSNYILSYNHCLISCPAVYTGDFNCQHTDWAYSRSNTDGDSGEMASATVQQQHSCTDPKEPRIFYSACWKSTFTPDLAFAKCHSKEPLQVRLILNRFPPSPSLITIPSLVQPLHRKDIKRWNLRVTGVHEINLFHHLRPPSPSFLIEPEQKIVCCNAPFFVGL